jgi:hypothetical protein
MFDTNPNEGAGWSNCADKGEADKVTATVSSADPPPRATPTVAEFMSAVVPWPVFKTNRSQRWERVPRRQKNDFSTRREGFRNAQS